MPKCMTATLADTIALAERLQHWFKARGKSLVSVADISIELVVKEVERKGEIPSEGQGNQSPTQEVN